MFVRLDEEITFYFPPNTDNDTLESFLNHLYPDKIFNYTKHKEKEYLLTDDMRGKLESVILKYSSGNLTWGSITFQIIRDEEFIELRSLQPISYLGYNDPCVVLTNQFNANTMFHILQFLDEEHQDEFFYALRAIINDDDSTAATKLALVSEYFFFRTIREIIPSIFKGSIGIVEVRKYIDSNNSWTALNNTLRIIHEKLKISDDMKTIIQTLFYGFDFLREQRNRAQHSTKLLSPYQCISMLSQLIFLTTEVEKLIEITRRSTPFT